MPEAMMTQAFAQPDFSAFYEQDRKRFPRVAATFAGHEQVRVHFTMRDLLVDHPPEVGGSGQGPSPGELLLAALAACTAVYIGRNAERYGVPVESIDVGASFETAHDPTDGPLDAVSYLDRVVKRVEVRGPLNQDQLAMVRFWAEHCAIGETLRRGVDLVEEVELLPPCDGQPPSGDMMPGGLSRHEDLQEGDAVCCGADGLDSPA
jgi:putative redox protein